MKNFCRRSCRAPVSLPRIVLLSLLLAWGVASAPTPLAAQTPAALAVSDTLYEIRLADGSTYIGQVVEAQGDQITLQSTAGVRITFNRAQIARVRPARGRVVEGEFWREDTNKTRLFFAPTGRTLEAGEGYAGLFFVLPFVSYGVTDWVTLSGGLPLIGSFDEGVPFFYLAPKVRVLSMPNTQVSTGVLAFFGGEDVGGIAYGVGTFGNADRAFTAGGGVPFLAGETADEFVVMLGGEYRTGRRSKLLTENWFIPGESGALLTGGIRLIGERWTTDLGIAAAVADGEGFYFPIVSFAYTFGGRR
ncbi:hypothetical protein BH24GEM3_BH24GEM3_20900 [soil metagenome]